MKLQSNAIQSTTTQRRDISLSFCKVALADIVALLAAILIGCAAPELCAQEGRSHLEYHGVTLRVDQRLSVGGDLFKIALFGEVFLVSASDAPRQVALRYIKHADLKEAEIRAVALAAAKNRDTDVLQAAVVLGVTSKAAVAFSSKELWSELVIDPEMRANLWQAVEGVQERALTQRLCLAGASVTQAEDDLQIVSSGMASIVRPEIQPEIGIDIVRPPGNPHGWGVPGGLIVPGVTLRRYVSVDVAELCIREVNRVALEQLFAGAAVERILEQLKREVHLFERQVGASESTRLASTVQRGIEGVAQALSELDSMRYEQALNALLVVNSDLGVSGDLTPARHLFIAKAITQGAWSVALEQLSRVRFELRSPLTHTQLVNALRGVSGSDWETILDPQIRPALKRYISKDEEVYAQWIATHRSLIIELLRAKSVDGAQRLVLALQGEDKTIASQLVPQMANAVVQGYLDQGDRQRAEVALRALSVKPNLKLTVRLFALRWMGSAVYLAGSLVVSLVCAALCFRRTKRAKLKRGGKPVMPTSVRSAADTCVAGSEPSAEYIAALNRFGLEYGATLAQIKNAYRAAVKQHHPDGQSGGVKEDTTPFIRLTKDYEKLLELYQQDKTTSA